jgi:intein-encoded DNA endonuclease-like protein
MKVTEKSIRERVINLYTEEYLNRKEISKIVGTSTTTVGNYLKAVGIVGGRNAYRFREDYFETIDTEDKAYYLGLMYADGNINNTRPLITIKLSEKDKEVLQTFNKYLLNRKPLYERKAEIIVGTSYIGKKQYKIELASNKMKSDLIDKGCVPRKSAILQFPTEEQVPKELIRHFIRGYFDGDGCIYKSQGKLMLNIVSTQNFLQGFYNTVNEKLGIQFNIHKEKRRESSYYIFISKKADVKKFCEYIYNGCTVKMERKYNKWVLE